MWSLGMFGFFIESKPIPSHSLVRLEQPQPCRPLALEYVRALAEINLTWSKLGPICPMK